MRHLLHLRRRFFLASLLLVIVGCASIPKEVVELSYRTGEDLAALYESYDKLIHEYYDKMRDERLAYLDEIWYPRFLQNWMEGGELLAIAMGDKIWSEKDSNLIATPSGADPQETLIAVRDWVDYALYSYEVKENILLEPLNEDEAALRREVEMAFRQVMRANATITAHLNSIREVKEVQDEALEALHIKDLRDKINNALVKASDSAASGLEKVRQLDESVDDLTEQVKSAAKTIK